MPMFARLLQTCTAAAMAGCAIDPAPLLALQAADDAIAEARRTVAGAGAAELARAESKRVLAERWMTARDYRPARWLAEQAKADAQLATVKAERARVDTGS